MINYIGKNYEIKQGILKEHQKTKLLYRIDTIDAQMINDCLYHYKNVSFENKIILDLGANIGGFTYMALRNNCKQIIAIEPDKYNFDLLKLNINDNKAILLQGAITVDDITELNFYFNQSK